MWKIMLHTDLGGCFSIFDITEVLKHVHTLLNHYIQMERNYAKNAHWTSYFLCGQMHWRIQGAHPVRAHLRVPILSLLHTNFTKT